jgi:hypothetical protein
MLVFRFWGLYLLLSCSVLAQKRPGHVVELDSSTYQYRVLFDNSGVNSQRMADVDITMQVSLNPLRPTSAIDIVLHFSNEIDLTLLDQFFFLANYECNQPQSCTAHSVSAYGSSKLVDHASRTVKYTMDGLKPGMRFKIVSVVFGLDGAPCGSDHSYTTYITMPPAPEDASKKILLVIDQEWENHEALNEAIEQYSRDLRRTMNIDSEKYYIGASISEKLSLYEYIKNQYFENNLGYLFFIGGNASVPVVTILLNQDQQVTHRFPKLSFTWYANVWHNAYTLDPSSNEFVSRKYQDVCYRSPQEIRNPVFQEYAAAISMAMLLPDLQYDRQQRAQHIVAYFDKLHRYKNYEIEFDRKVLSSDGFTGELETISRVGANGRWSAVDTVKLGRVKDFYYSGYDNVWKEDYLSKLQNNSYEIFNYNGHGSPTYHSFGMTNSDISALNALNTQVLNFHSCDVGKFTSANYLANQYLGKGNVLAVHAYSDLLFEYSSNGESTLARDFRQYGPFTWMSKGYTVSDAFRYGSGYIETNIILGDPLLKLREVCGSVIESQISGDWHDRTTWTCGRIPTKNDVVRILSGHSISLSSKGDVKEITIEGSLDLSAGGELTY